MSGDGGFTMLMGDLLTLAQYDLPIENFRRSIERNVRYAIPATIPLNSPRAFKIRGTPRRS